MKNKNKNKKIFNALLTLCAALVLMGGFSVTAYAQTPEGQDDATDDSGVVYEEPEKEEPLTPDGNATLVDDFGGNKPIAGTNDSPFPETIEASAMTTIAITIAFIDRRRFIQSAYSIAFILRPPLSSGTA